jgi:hypothetical protein
MEIINNIWNTLQEEKLNVNEDTLICNALVQSHDAFINSVKSRFTKLEVCVSLPIPHPPQKEKKR